MDLWMLQYDCKFGFFTWAIRTHSAKKAFISSDVVGNHWLIVGELGFFSKNFTANLFVSVAISSHSESWTMS